jgi:transposase
LRDDFERSALRRLAEASKNASQSRRLLALAAVYDGGKRMPLPPRAPELNPVENIWQFMRDNWLSNRIFNTDRPAHGNGGTPTPAHSCGTPADVPRRR